MQHKNTWGSAFLLWLPLAIAIIIMTGLAYMAVQQSYRMSANDPQIQIAEDIVTAISQGTSPDAIVSPNPSLDIAASLSSFVTIYDDSGKPIGSSVALDGKMPTLPSGVFDNAKKNGQDRFTWQPKKDLRIAAVVTRYSSGEKTGYVLAGRSLKEVETRIKSLALMSAIAGLAALVLSFIAALLYVKVSRPHHHEAAAEETTHHAHNS